MCKRSLWFLLISFAVIYLGWVGAHTTDEICLSVFSPSPCDFWRSNWGHWAWRVASTFTCWAVPWAKYQIVHKKNMMWSWSRYHKADINVCKQDPFFTAWSSIGNNKSWSKALCTLIRKQDPLLKITSVLEIALEAVRYQNDPVKPSHMFLHPLHYRAPPAPASPRS